MPKIITGRRPILSDRFPTNGMRMTATTLLQGFAVGGEIDGASAMILEHSPFGRRGYFGSFTLQGPQAGQIIAAAVFLPLSEIMSKEAFESWAGGSRHRYPQVVGRRQPDAVARTGGIGEAEHTLTVVGMAFIRAMQITRSMSEPFSRTAITMGAAGTSPCSASSWKAGVSSTRRLMT